jgi:hypothetical protein
MDNPGSHPGQSNRTDRREEKRRLASMVSVRLSPEEERAVREAAGERGESVSSFIRNVVLAEVRPALAAPLSAATSSSVTRTVGLTLEYVEGGKLMPRSASPLIHPT